MAKIYGEIASSALMTFDKSFARSNGQPLDSTEVFYSYTAAEDYAKTDVAYVSQKIAVIETTDGVTTVTHYSIEADNTLKELGAIPIGDNVTIEVVNGKIQIAGLTGHSAGTYQPYLVDGKIEWREPSATTVEGLDSRLTTAEDDIDNLEKSIGEVPENKTITEMIADAQAAATYDETALVARVSDNESAIAILKGEVTVEGSVKKALADANSYTDDKIALIMNNSTDAIDSVMELADAMSDNKDAIEALTEIAGSKAAKDDLNAVAARVGTLEEEMDTAQEDISNLKNNKADTTTVNELTNIVNNKIDSSALTPYAKTEDVNKELDKKVNVTDATAENGIRFINEEEITKLGKLNLDGEDLTISAAVGVNNVTGLNQRIIDVVTSAETASIVGDSTVNGLGIERGAQVNILESINFNGQDIQIVDKKATFEYKYTLPIADANILGGVKSSESENNISVTEDGTMEVYSLNVNKLTQTDGEYIVLDGGSANR